MKKNVKCTVFLALGILPLVNLTSCSKQDIPAPTIESVFQDLNSAFVYVKPKTMTSPGYAPAFRINDGDWYNATVSGEGGFNILFYNEQNDNFTLAIESSTVTYNVGDTIEVAIRENETDKYKASPASETKSIVLRSLSRPFSVVNEYKTLGTINHEENTEPTFLSPHYAACYDDSASKYVLAFVRYSDVTYTESKYRYDEYINKVYDKELIEIKYVSGEDFNLNEPELLKKYESIQYQSFDTYYEINSKDFVKDQYSNESAKVIFRTKEKQTSLASIDSILSISKLVASYHPGNETIADFNFTQVGQNLTFNITNNKNLTMNEISANFYVDVCYNYSNDHAYKRALATAEIRDETGTKRESDITYSDNGKKFKLVFVDNAKKTDFCSFDVTIAYQNI